MNPTPVCIYQAANAGEAQLVKDLLQEEGIEAHIVGENQPYAGLVAAMSVDVLVAEDDQSRAREIVVRHEQQQAAQANLVDWRCPRCGSEVPGTFDLCFKCGADRTGNPPAEPADEA